MTRTFEIVDRTAFVAELRRLGFVRDGARRREEPSTFALADHVHGRTVDVQRWPDGQHRASHCQGHGHRWIWTTRPTDFTTVAGMVAAIACEWTRPNSNWPWGMDA